MKKKRYNFRLILIIIKLLQYGIILLIAYIVIWGLIIEPHMPKHYYGITDLIEFVEAILLIIPLVLLSSVKGFFKMLRHFSKRMRMTVFEAFKTIQIFKSVFKIRKNIVFDEKFFNNVLIRSGYVYLISGLATGLMLEKAYCFAWSLSSDGSDIHIYRVICHKGKFDYYKIKTVSVGSECIFTLEYKSRLEIKWRLYVLDNSKWDLIYRDKILASNNSLWGINLAHFENLPLR